MNLQLSTRAHELIRRKLAEGRYASAEEVIEQALELLDYPEPTLESLQAKLQVGLDDIAAGRISELRAEADVDAFFESLINHSDERTAQAS
jgi:putative addiction module CopG family antidote